MRNRWDIIHFGNLVEIITELKYNRILISEMSYQRSWQAPVPIFKHLTRDYTPITCITQYFR